MREVFRSGFWGRYATESTMRSAGLVVTRPADRPAAAEKKYPRVIHVPLLETDRTPRSEPLRRRLRLRIRLAPHAGRLVFRRDARADLVGVRPRCRAVEHFRRRRRRGHRGLGLRPLLLLRALVSNLFARLPVAAVTPVNSLAFRRAILCRSTRTVQHGRRFRPTNRTSQSQL